MLKVCKTILSIPKVVIKAKITTQEALLKKSFFVQKVCKKLCRKYAKNSIHTRSRHKSQDTHKGRIKGKHTKQGALLKQSF